MPFYEEIYETGAHSVANYADDDEAMIAVKDHHDRAKEGADGGPVGTGHKAQRVVAVLVYPNHPATYGEDESFSSDEVEARVKEALESNKDENGVVFLPAVLSEVRDLSFALNSDSGAHESNYKMPEERSIPSKNWEGGK